MRGFARVLIASMALPLVSATKLSEDLIAGRSQPTEDGQRELDGHLIAGDFDDNTLGYCLSDNLEDLAAVDLLFHSHVEAVDEFLQVVYVGDMEKKVAIDELTDFVSLTRVYLPTDLATSLSDEEVLLSIMFPQAEGPDRPIDNDCLDALRGALSRTLEVYFDLMGIGASFDFDTMVDALIGDLMEDMVDDEMLHEPVNGRLAYSHVLAQMERGIPIFPRFIDVFHSYQEGFGVNRFFNDLWLQGVISWEEMALTPFSIVAKYAAVYLAQGEQLEAKFDELGAGPRLTQIYDNAVAVCNKPTQMPTSAPSFGPETENRFMPVISVATATQSSMEEIAESWETFRDKYPDRLFCLLQIRGNDGDDLKVPQDFIFDPNVIYKQVSYDYGDSFRQSDWYDLCDIRLYGDFIETFPVYVGPDIAMVQSSYDFYEDRTDGGVVLVQDPLSNWIAPLEQDF